MLPSNADDCAVSRSLRYAPNKAAFQRAVAFCCVLPHLNDFGLRQLGVEVSLAFRDSLPVPSVCNDFRRLSGGEGVAAGCAFPVAAHFFRVAPVDAGYACCVAALGAREERTMH